MIKNKYSRQALIMIAIISAAALLFSSCGNKKTIPDSNYSNKITNSDSNKDADKNTDDNSNSNKDANKDNNKTQITKGPEFSAGKYEGEPQFATGWIKSSDGSISACIDGKGSEVSEEGIGKIIIKDSKNNKTILQLKDKSNQQSPLHISWWSNEDLLVVIGNGYGTVSKGGNLYIVNIKNGKSAAVVETKDSKTQVVNAQRDNNNLKYEIAVFEDDNFIKYHMENKVFSDYSDKMNDMINQLK